MIEREPVFLNKARESLNGAESEFVNERYNNCANRCYYAAFQAAIVALSRAGIRPSGREWSHAFVPAQFEGQLIYRRKLYPTELRGALEQTAALRTKADYSEDFVTRREATRALGQTRTFLETIEARGGEPR